MHGRPDVVEELNLNDWLHAARGVANGATDNIGFSQRRVEDALGTELVLKSRGELEDAAFSLDFRERLRTAGVCHVLAIDDDAGVTAHLVVEAGIDEVGHCARATSLCTAGDASAGKTRTL